MSAQEPSSVLSSLLQSNVVFGVLVLTLVSVYFGSERSVLHFSRNLRRFYFLILVALLGYWILTAVQHASDQGIEVLLVFVVIVASVIEDKMERALYLTPFSSAALEDVAGTPEAVGKAELLVEIVGGMNRWQGFSIGLAKQLAWLDGSLHKHQAAIHQVLESSDRLEINYILAHSNCAFLLEVAAERSFDLLTDPCARLKDLSTLSRAILLDGFQKIGLRHRAARQLCAHRILLETRGWELCRLKSYLDDAPDHHTTFKLLYNDLQGPIQQKVLEHVSREGRKALRKHREKHPDAPGMNIKVVSDIDDTLMCSGGHFPAGSDTSFPKGCVYPGVLAFYRALERSFSNRLQVKPGSEPNASVKNEPSTAPNISCTSAAHAGLRTSLEAQQPAPEHSGRRPRSPSCKSVPSEHGRSRDFEEATQRRPPGPHPADGMEAEPSGTLSSIAESSCWSDDDDDGGDGAESARRSPVQGAGLAGTSVGAALGAVMPSAGSMQNMVGLTLLTGAPSAEAIQPQLQRTLTVNPPDSVMLGSEVLRCDGVVVSAVWRTAPNATLLRECLASGARCMQRDWSTASLEGRPLLPCSGQLVFLSARPESYKGFTEVLSFKRIFEPLVRCGELQGYPVLLLGSLRVGPTALYAYAADRRGAPGPASRQFYHALAAKKLARFKQFAAIYPECCWIFVGDNGQGDVLLAEHLVELLGEQMVASFVHEVVPLAETVTQLSAAGRVATGAELAGWLEAWRRRRLHVGGDYVSLAAEARGAGLLGDDELRQVAASACHDLRHVAARFSHVGLDRAAASRQLNAGLRAANCLLPAQMQVPLLDEPGC